MIVMIVESGTYCQDSMVQLTQGQIIQDTEMQTYYFYGDFTQEQSGEETDLNLYVNSQVGTSSINLIDKIVQANEICSVVRTTILDLDGKSMMSGVYTRDPNSEITVTTTIILLNPGPVSTFQKGALTFKRYNTQSCQYQQSLNSKFTLLYSENRCISDQNIINSIEINPIYTVERCYRQCMDEVEECLFFDINEDTNSPDYGKCRRFVQCQQTPASGYNIYQIIVQSEFQPVCTDRYGIGQLELNMITRYYNCDNAFPQSEISIENLRQFEHPYGGYYRVWILPYEDTNNCQWQEVRSIPKDHVAWHQAPELNGLAVYGDKNDDSQPWSINFSSIIFNMFMFTTGDFNHWVITTKADVLNGFPYENKLGNIIKSHQGSNLQSNFKYTNDIIKDCPCLEITYDNNKVIYRGGSNEKELNELQYGGNKVFIRNSANPQDSSDICNGPPDYWKEVPQRKYIDTTIDNCIMINIEIIYPQPYHCETVDDHDCFQSSDMTKWTKHQRTTLKSTLGKIQDGTSETQIDCIQECADNLDCQAVTFDPPPYVLGSFEVAIDGPGSLCELYMLDEIPSIIHDETKTLFTISDPEKVNQSTYQYYEYVEESILKVNNDPKCKASANVCPNAVLVDTRQNINIRFQVKLTRLDQQVVLQEVTQVVVAPWELCSIDALISPSDFWDLIKYPYLEFYKFVDYDYFDQSQNAHIINPLSVKNNAVQTELDKNIVELKIFLLPLVNMDEKGIEVNDISMCGLKITMKPIDGSDLLFQRLEFIDGKWISFLSVPLNNKYMQVEYNFDGILGFTKSSLSVEPVYRELMRTSSSLQNSFKIIREPLCLIDANGMAAIKSYRLDDQNPIEVGSSTLEITNKLSTSITVELNLFNHEALFKCNLQYFISQTNESFSPIPPTQSGILVQPINSNIHSSYPIKLLNNFSTKQTYNFYLFANSTEQNSSQWFSPLITILFQNTSDANTCQSLIDQKIVQVDLVYNDTSLAKNGIFEYFLKTSILKQLEIAENLDACPLLVPKSFLNGTIQDFEPNIVIYDVLPNVKLIWSKKDFRDGKFLIDTKDNQEGFRTNFQFFFIDEKGGKASVLFSFTLCGTATLGLKECPEIILSREEQQQELLQKIKVNFPPTFQKDFRNKIIAENLRAEFDDDILNNRTQRALIQQIKLPPIADYERDQFKVIIKTEMNANGITFITNPSSDEYILNIDHSQFYLREFQGRQEILIRIVLDDGKAFRPSVYPVLIIFDPISDLKERLNDTRKNTTLTNNLKDRQADLKNNSRLSLKDVLSQNITCENSNQTICDKNNSQNSTGNLTSQSNSSNSSTIKKEPPQEAIEVFSEPEVKLTRKKVPIVSTFAGVQIQKQQKVYKAPVPIQIVVYEKVEEIFKRDNPTLRKTTIDKKGNLQINFSKGMVFPPNWYNMQINDQNMKKNGIRVLQEKADGKDFPRLMVVNAFGEELFEVERDAYKLNELDPTRIKLKLEWANPSIISLSSQNELDNLVIKWPDNLILTDVDGNSLVMDDAEESKDGGTFDTQLNIQPQLDDMNPQQQSFENQGDSIQNTGKLITVIQFGITYVFQTSLAHFWGLINSQQNLAYLPSMNVNLPAPVTSYTEKLIVVATFDPIPMDIVYEYFEIFDFQWTQRAPSVTTFAPIGYEDCIFVLALGSMFLWMCIFLVCITVTNFTDCFKFNNSIRQIGKKFKIVGYYRMYIIIFLLEGYIDLFISSLINLDNEALFHVPGNFGLNGNLNISDQFSIILGYLFYWSCLAFPVFVQYISWRKINQNLFRMHRTAHFENMYSCVYEGFKTYNQGPMLFNNVFILRRIVFVWVCFFYSDPIFTCFQVFFNLLLSCIFLGYLLVMKPYEDLLTQKLEVINELTYTIISYHLICFTDFNPDAEAKLVLGYSMIGCSILNMCFPNLYLVLRDIIPVIYDETINWYRNKKKPKENNEAKNFFEEKRKELIDKYQLKLKEEFKQVEEEEEDDSEDYETLTEIKKSKVVPQQVLEMDAMRQMQHKNIYEYREKKRQQKFIIKKLTMRPPAINLENSLSNIREDNEENEYSSYIANSNDKDKFNHSITISFKSDAFGDYEQASSIQKGDSSTQNNDFANTIVKSGLQNEFTKRTDFEPLRTRHNITLNSTIKKVIRLPYQSSSDSTSLNLNMQDEVKNYDTFSSYSRPPNSSKNLISYSGDQVSASQGEIRQIIYGVKNEEEQNSD